ncbi:MAG TPA: hypothetical protein VMZ26_03060 [Pyrinomonadaceae bacterium]|nr:hypothetical protein [Pyrinomonadaceae bacterium]
MQLNASANSHLSLVPLGPGDLIDRAVRFYRQNFWTFVFIAAPPVITGTLISVGWTFVARSLFSVSSANNAFDLTLYYLFVWLGSAVIWFTETVATLSVMGGASRNFVRHLLFNEPLTFRETYANTWKRLAGLLAASSIIAVLLGTVGFVVLYLGLIIGALLVVLVVGILSVVPPLAALVGILVGGAATFGTVWLFFLVASRFAYVPQVMLVEGQGVFSSISRSASLASGNVKRLAALFIFSIVATYSALALFYIPLLWYAWAQGVEVFTFEPDIVPAWYEISSQLLSQASLILLTPVWMVGLCLLYVDERVRHEGYDIELMAARRLGEIPEVPQTYINPLQPALATQNVPPPPVSSRGSSLTTLNLK